MLSGTNTGLALQYVSNELLKKDNGNRPGVPDILLVITDGRAQDDQRLEQESRVLQTQGVLVSKRCSVRIIIEIYTVIESVKLSKNIYHYPVQIAFACLQLGSLCSCY